MKRKTTEIHIETRERIIFRQTTTREIVSICVACQIETVFIQPERAAFFCGLSTREIYRRIERGTIHFVENKAGETLVCANSLAADIGILLEINSKPEEKQNYE